MKKIIVLIFMYIPSFSQDEIKKPINDFFRIVSASTKTLDDSGLKDILAADHTLVNDLKMQSVYDYTKFLINSSLDLTLLSQVNEFAHIKVFGENAYVVVYGTDKARYKGKDINKRFIASFMLVFNNQSKKWIINNIHMTNEK